MAENNVEILVTSRDKTSLGGKKMAVEGESEQAAGRIGQMFDKLGSHIGKSLGNIGQNLGKGGGIFAAGSGLLAMAGPLGAATVAIGAFAAVAIPALSKVSAASNQIQAAQFRYAHATTTAGRTAALNAEKAAIANNNLTKSQVGLIAPLNQLQAAFGKLQDKATPALGAILKMATALMPLFSILVRAGGRLILGLVAPLDALINSPFFTRFSHMIGRLAAQMGDILGPALVSLIKLLMLLFRQAGPAGVQLLGILLPLIIQLATDLIPVIAAVAQMIVVTLQWLQHNHLLLPVLALVAVAILAMEAPISAVIAAVIILIAIGVELSKHWRQIWADIKRYVADAVDFIRAHWQVILVVLTGPIGAAVVWIVSHWAAVRRVFSDAVGFIKTVWAAVENVLEAPVRAAAAVISGIINGIKAAVSWVAGVFSGGTPAPPRSNVPGSFGGPGRAHGGITGAASGGLRSGLTMVAEHGRELIALAPGSRVMSNPDTERQLAGGGPVRVVLEFRSGQSLFDQFMLGWVLKTVQVKGGGDVQVAFGGTG